MFHEAELPPEETHKRRMQEFIDVFLSDRFATRERAIAEFQRHIEEVRSTIPPERLLVYELGSGWAALCEFLGVPVPEQDYPHTNSSAAFQKSNIEFGKDHD